MSSIVVVDLDGCFCSVNSFRLWLVYSFIVLLLTFRWGRLIMLLQCVIQRLLSKVDRVTMKRCVLLHTSNMPKWVLSLFVFILGLFVNQRVAQFVNKYLHLGKDVILSTAAPLVYADLLGRRYGFSRVFATHAPSSNNWSENFGQQKLRSLISYYGNDVIFECVISDHADDIPLLERARQCILVRPSRQTLEKIGDRFTFTILN